MPRERRRFENDAGVATVTDSSISGNYAGYSGGGIYNYSISGTLGTLTLTDSTVSDNTTLNFGGGIDDAGGVLTISDSILNGNEA